ncbi:MAG: acyl-CoA dehydratase activase-related protein [Deltaproteobacteria bacterium]|jgi:predicted nucleotide-binding protein (sugar kinase/HSP70/actin superfamily)|nr:acyl-CoA dehydratase activase-related protein [Deltaproteobacteria bacterium]
MSVCLGADLGTATFKAALLAESPKELEAFMSRKLNGFGRFWRPSGLPADLEGRLAVSVLQKVVGGRSKAAGEVTDRVTTALTDSLSQEFEPCGMSRLAIEDAVEAGWAAEQSWERRKAAAGSEALEVLGDRGEPGLILAGRSYLVFQRESCLDLPKKLRVRYGANLIPAEFLVTGPSGKTADGWWWPWSIERAAELVGSYEGLHLILLAMATCPADRSLTDEILTELTKGKFLRLEFGGHQHDAGFLTRCEAYLAGKDILWPRK